MGEHAITILKIMTSGRSSKMFLKFALKKVDLQLKYQLLSECMMYLCTNVCLCCWREIFQFYKEFNSSECKVQNMKHTMKKNGKSE